MSVGGWIGLGGLILTIVLALIAHAVHDAIHQGRTNAEIENIKRDIGTHESGLRGEQHRLANLIGRLRGIVYFIGKKLKLDVMKDLDDE